MDGHCQRSLVRHHLRRRLPEVPRDDEAEQYWIETGVPKERIFTYGRKDNFWQMGETGPCGPCSELFFDMGIEAAETPGVDKPFGQDDARYVEIWNLVFMQFDRSAIVDCKGNVTYKLTPLPKPSIDTGMGLERVAAVLQGKLSNFETDLFRPLIERAWDLIREGDDSWIVFEGLSDAEEVPHSASSRTTSRATTFLINDGVLPSNEGRGYVLRKIMRRAIRHGRLLGQEKPFLNQMVFAVRDLMQGAYPELIDSAPRVAKVVEAEEKQFDRVLKFGASKLDQELVAARQSGDRPVLKGETAFHLYETFGLPQDFIQDACRDAEVFFDEKSFEAAKEAEQSRARALGKAAARRRPAPSSATLLALTSSATSSSTPQMPKSSPS